MESSANTATPKRGSRLKRILLRTVIFLLALLILVFLAFKLSPWPSALLIRHAFEKGATQANESLAKYVPAGISELLNQPYDLNDKDAFLDVYYPSDVKNTERALPVIVWIHGGGWVSGHKEDIANYCRILASKGYTTVSVDYSVAPEKKYPTPLKQMNVALAYLASNAKRLHIDSNHFVLAGDSGGAHIAAQTGAIICNSSYAQLFSISPGIAPSQLSGLLLYCGPYDVENVNLSGSYGWFNKSILWAYLGKKDFTQAPLYKTFSVINYVDGHFPPSFISAGNGDPLQIQSQTLARKLATLNVKVDTLFFATDYSPSLPHEYQFNLDTDAGKKALAQSVQFLTTLLAMSNNPK